MSVGEVRDQLHDGWVDDVQEPLGVNADDEHQSNGGREKATFSGGEIRKS